MFFMAGVLITQKQDDLMAMAKRQERMPTENLYFEDFEIGQTYPDFNYSLSQEDLAVHRSCYACTFGFGEAAKETAENKTISPFVLNSFLAIRASFGMPNGVLHSREEITMHGPAYASDKLKVQLSVLNKYEKNGRPFIVFRHRITRQDESPVMDVDRTVCWIRPQDGEQKQ